MLLLNTIIVNFLERSFQLLDESAQVKVIMQIGLQYWKWPNRNDIILYKWCDVIKTLDPPVTVSNRGTF